MVWIPLARDARPLISENAVDNCFAINKSFGEIEQKYWKNIHRTKIYCVIPLTGQLRAEMYIFYRRRAFTVLSKPDRRKCNTNSLIKSKFTRRIKFHSVAGRVFRIENI
jgi:hypothetical protein